MSDLVFIICPPYPEYKEAPKDQSAAELFDCPHCKNKMWLSQKKKGLLLFYSCANKNIYLCCYNCSKEFCKNNSDVISSSRWLGL